MSSLTDFPLPPTDALCTDATTLQPTAQQQQQLTMAELSPGNAGSGHANNVGIVTPASAGPGPSCAGGGNNWPPSPASAEQQQQVCPWAPGAAEGADVQMLSTAEAEADSRGGGGSDHQRAASAGGAAAGSGSGLVRLMHLESIGASSSHSGSVSDSDAETDGEVEQSAGMLLQRTARHRAAGTMPVDRTTTRTAQRAAISGSEGVQTKMLHLQLRTTSSPMMQRPSELVLPEQQERNCGHSSSLLPPSATDAGGISCGDGASSAVTTGSVTFMP